MTSKAIQNSDSDLISRIQAGEKQEFEMLVKRYYKQAFSMALGWTHNREVALDISQDAFVRVHKNIQSFDLSRSFVAWLYTIVRNLCRNYISRQRGRTTVFSDLLPSESLASAETVETLFLPSTPAETGDRYEFRQALWTEIQRLPVVEREVVLLKDFENFTYKEIAEALEIPIGTVMSRLYNARKHLSVKLEEFKW